jgi:hypothetical protein
MQRGRKEKAAQKGEKSAAKGIAKAGAPYDPGPLA